ncbi:hypothetical protein D3C87_1563110 [compost metagenome]
MLDTEAELTVTQLDGHDFRRTGLYLLRQRSKVPRRQHLTFGRAGIEPVDVLAHCDHSAHALALVLA